MKKEITTRSFGSEYQLDIVKKNKSLVEKYDEVIFDTDGMGVYLIKTLNDQKIIKVLRQGLPKGNKIVEPEIITEVKPEPRHKKTYLVVEEVDDTTELSIPMFKKHIRKEIKTDYFDKLAI